MDLDVEGWSVGEVDVLCEAYGASYVGLPEDGHIHCDWRDDPLAPVVYGVSRAEASVVRIVVAEARLIRDGTAWDRAASGFDEGDLLRHWKALDAHSRVLAEARGRSVTPPADTVRIAVKVDRYVHLSTPVSAEELR